MKLAWMRSTGLPAPEKREYWSSSFRTDVSEAVWTQGYTAYNTFTMQQVQELYFYLYTVGLTLPTVSVDFDYLMVEDAHGGDPEHTESHSVTLAYTPPVGAETITYSKTLNARIAPAILDYFPLFVPPEALVGNALIEPDFQASGFPLRTDDFESLVDTNQYEGPNGPTDQRLFYSQLDTTMEIWGNMYFSYIGVNPATNEPTWTISSQGPDEDVEILNANPFAKISSTAKSKPDLLLAQNPNVVPITGSFTQEYFIPSAAYDVDNRLLASAGASIETIILGSVSITFLKFTSADALDFNGTITDGLFTTWTYSHSGTTSDWGINSHTLNPPVS